jgi:hypothetical protein
MATTYGGFEHKPREPETQEPVDGDVREVNLPSQVWAMIDQLKATGIWGLDHSEVVFNLVREPLMNASLKGYCSLPKPTT